MEESSAAARAILRARARLGARNRLVVDLPAEAMVAFKQLVEETGESPAALVVKALGLYRLAREAKGQGKAVGSAPSPDVLDTEFTGV